MVATDKGGVGMTFHDIPAGFLHADQRAFLLLGNLWLTWGLVQALQKRRALADADLEAKPLAKSLPSP